MSPVEFIPLLFIFFMSVVLHEYAHGWVAYNLGDSTAKSLGRLTLNPIKHIDPIGTIALPLMLFMTGSPFLFGWAKPVPVNFLNLHNPKRDMIWVGLAGPSMNILLAIFFSLLLRSPLPGVSFQLIEFAIIINLILAVFNMVPIPPLDGSRLVMGLLPNKYAYLYSRLEPYGIILVFIFLYLGLFRRFVLPLVILFASYLGV